MNHNHFVPGNGSSVGSSAVPDQGKSTGANAGSTRTHKSAGKVVDPKPKEAVHPHAKIPHADLEWVLTQPPPVIRLFMESWRCESFGKQERLLKTTLRGENLREARRVIEQVGLFKYVPVMELNKKHRWTIVGWKCENLHGYYTNYWDEPAESGLVPADSRLVPADSRLVPADSRLVPADSRLVPADSGKKQAETTVQQAIQNSQPRFNQGLTTHQPPTKVVGGVVGNLKQEESPEGATDCPTLSGGIGSDDKSESQLGAEPPDPQTQSLETRLPGGEMLSPPKGDPPLVASQGEEVSSQFLKGGTESPESDNSLAALEDQKAAPQESKNLGEDNLPAAPVQCETSEIGEPPTVEITSIMSPSFPQLGDKAVLDWPESLYHQKVGTIQTVHTESGEAEIRFEGINFDLTFPTNRLLPAAVLSVGQVATPALTAGFKIGDRVWWDNVPRHADFRKPFEIARFIGNTAWLKGYSRRAVPLSELRLADASNLET